MCHHKAPHRPFAPAPRHARLFENETIPVPESFDDDYKNRARAAGAARLRVRTDMNNEATGLAWPEGRGHPWGRADESSVGHTWVRMCTSRWTPVHRKKQRT